METENLATTKSEERAKAINHINEAMSELSDAQLMLLAMNAIEFQKLSMHQRIIANMREVKV